MENSILNVNHLNAYFGEAKILSDINLEIPKNQIVAFMGPSGCGKTTFLRCIILFLNIVTKILERRWKIQF